MHRSAIAMLSSAILTITCTVGDVTVTTSGDEGVVPPAESSSDGSTGLGATSSTVDTDTAASSGDTSTSGGESSGSSGTTSGGSSESSGGESSEGGTTTGCAIPGCAFNPTFGACVCDCEVVDPPECGCVEVGGACKCGDVPAPEWACNWCPDLIPPQPCPV